MNSGPASESAEGQPFTVTDKRKLDPQTGEVRMPNPEGLPDELAGVDLEAESDLGLKMEAAGDPTAELTADLQRLAAEYANYRKRTERERETLRTNTIGGVLGELLPILDDVGRARAHGDLEGAFRTVGENLESAASRLGLEQYGAVGDPFDPQLHEAFTHTVAESSTGAGATVTVISAVYEPGYRHAGRVLRHARVAVEDRDAGPGEPVVHIDTVL